MYTIRQTLLGNVRALFSLNSQAANPQAQVDEIPQAELQSLLDHYTGENVSDTTTTLSNNMVLRTQEIAKCRNIAELKKLIADAKLTNRVAVPAVVTEAAAPEVAAAAEKKEVVKTAIKDATAEKVANERTEQGNETQANAVLKLLELKHPEAAKELSYDMKEYFKHVNVASLTRLLSVGNAALVELKSEFRDDGGLTRKVGLQLQEI